MKSSPPEIFRKEVNKTLDQLTAIQGHGDPRSRRHSAVIQMLSWLARKLDSLAELPKPLLPTLDPDTALIFAPLAHFKFDSDETSPDKINPAMLGDIVEQYATDRALTGAYYTPAPLASHICRQALEVVTGVKLDQLNTLPQNERSSVVHCLRDLQVIDPACGSGAFLIAMYREYGTWCAELKVASDEPPQLHLCGVDLDPLAVAVTKFRLSMVQTRTRQANRRFESTDSLVVGDGLSVIPERMSHSAFDIVVTNPPFGVQATVEQRNRFFDPKRDGVQSRDMYGLFMARSLELLRPGGVAVLLVSDTWRTIRRHLPLRKRLIDNTTIYSVVDLPPWVFNATVNTGIICWQNVLPREEHQILALDLRSAPKDDWKLLGESIQGPPDFPYLQAQIGRYDNQSVFIASPRIHGILTDNAFTTLGQIATVRQGLATGDNRRYLRKQSSARGNYAPVDSRRVLTRDELESLTTDEKLNGISRDRFDGRTFVPYDKGGASFAIEGWLPNYFVPTEYFIDWSRESVARMKTATSSRQGGKIASRFQSSAQYFKQGITFSYTGFYAPCFRLSSGGVFDVGGSSCFDLQLPLYPVLAILASKLLKYIAKNYINHTVNFQVDDFKALPLPRQIDADMIDRLSELVGSIVNRQEVNPQYPYAAGEQLTVDALVYRLFGLSDAEIREVESWYARRYARLACAGNDNPLITPLSALPPGRRGRRVRRDRGRQPDLPPGQAPARPKSATRAKRKSQPR